MPDGRLDRASASANRPLPALPIGLLALAGFLSSAGARVMDALLSAVAADFEVSVPAVSVVVAAFTLPYGLSQLVLGPVGDRFGKLRVILGALLGYTVFTGACALATDLPALTLLRAASGAASAGLIPVCMAYIGDTVPYALRQVTLSRFLTGAVMAQVVAGPVGGVFGQYLGWRGVFVVLSGAALAAAAVLALRMRKLADRRHNGATFSRANYAALARDRGARTLLLATVVEGGLLVGCFPFFAPYLHERFGLSYSAVGLMLACFGLGALLYTRIARHLLRLLGERGMVAAGGGLIAAGIAVGITADIPWAFAPVQAVMGLGYLMLHSVLQARATELLPDARATSVSTFAFMLFLGQSLGALLMGAGIATLGYHRSFLLEAAGIALLAAGLTVVLRHRPAGAMAARS